MPEPTVASAANPALPVHLALPDLYSRGGMRAHDVKEHPDAGSFDAHLR